MTHLERVDIGLPVDEFNIGKDTSMPNKMKGRSGVLPLLPFLMFVTIFLLVPTITLFVRASRRIEGGTKPAMMEAMSNELRGSFVYSAKLSVVSALSGAAIGFLFAVAVTRIDRPRWLRTWVTGFSGVAANLGGIPLAFAFIATLGVQGLVTRILYHWGVDIYDSGFTIASFWGIVVVYLYFQIPLMVLVMLPAIDGLKPTWSEACANVGGSRSHYWRFIGLPILFPPILGGFLLLFANAFSAYATAFALSSGASKLVPVQIRFFLQGETITGRGNLGYALAGWMVIILIFVLGSYLALRRRTEKWKRG